ncbi:MAG: caspase family protein [Phormidesmis sp.]
MAKVALLIGVSEYEPGLNPLPAAVKDLDALREVLIDSEIGGFAETDVTLLKNPDRQAVEEAIYMLFADRQRDDLVLLFFSGHGIKDDSGTLYLATRGTRKSSKGELISFTAVSANYIHDRMSRSRSKRQVVILDSCFSGAFAEGLSAKDDGTIDIRAQLGGEGRAVLTSSSSTQYSFEQEGEDLSMYTRFLIEGIKTGEADGDGDDVVSIDELHQYASRKVQEVKPELRPEMYAMREGFKIRLFRVPQGDPRQRYQKEVARCGQRGELTIVSRSILNTWRTKLGLSPDEAVALEDEILEPYRKAFQQKLQEYEQTVVKVLYQDVTIKESTRQELQQLQQVLELRNEDTIPIEAKVVARLKTRKQNLKSYQADFSEALRQAYPLSDVARLQLQQRQRQLTLSDADVASIEAQVTAEVETYRRNLQQYEQAFLAATRQEYPLSKARRDELRQHQQSLNLSDVEVAPIEAKVTTQVETYQQKLQQYEDAFVGATQRKNLPGEATIAQLKQTWQTLGLREADIKTVEAPILAKIKTYQANLQQYEQAFADATEAQYPLSEAKRSELRSRQTALNLSDEDIAPIESQLSASFEDRLEKLQQYEQVFSDSIQFELPVSEATREELNRFQQVLELSDADVTQIEAKVIAQSQQADALQVIGSQFSPSVASTGSLPGTQTTSQTIEGDVQANQSPSASQKYELGVAQWIQHGISLDDSQIRRHLNSFRIDLGLSRSEAESIEMKLTGGTQTPNTSQPSRTASPPVQSQYRQEEVRRPQSAARISTTPSPQPKSTAQQSVETPSATNKKSSGSLPKAARRRILLGSTALGLVLIMTGFSLFSFATFWLGTFILLTGGACVWVWGRAQSEASWRLWRGWSFLAGLSVCWLVWIFLTWFWSFDAALLTTIAVYLASTFIARW